MAGVNRLRDSLQFPSNNWISDGSTDMDVCRNFQYYFRFIMTVSFVGVGYSSNRRKLLALCKLYCHISSHFLADRTINIDISYSVVRTKIDIYVFINIPICKAKFNFAMASILAIEYVLSNSIFSHLCLFLFVDWKSSPTTYKQYVK